MVPWIKMRLYMPQSQPGLYDAWNPRCTDKTDSIASYQMLA